MQKLWIVTYSHRHGADTWPRFGTEAPSIEAEIEDLESWEGEDRGDFLEISGPFDLPPLVAAAPDMLEALRELVAEADLGEIDLEPEDRAKLERARAVIAKAEGRAPIQRGVGGKHEI